MDIEITKDDIINNYWIFHTPIEVLVCEIAGKRLFVVADSDSGTQKEVTEDVAKSMCITPSSRITEENWEDFCTARGIFTEDN